MEENEKLISLALERAGLIGGESVIEVAEKLTAHLSPKITVVEDASQKLVLDITSSVDGSLFCGITTGNKNLEAYIFPGGHQNAITRVGHFDHIVSVFLSREMLTKIALIELIRPIKLGGTIRVSITITSKKGPYTTCVVEGWDPGTNKAVMKPSTVTTYGKK